MATASTDNQIITNIIDNGRISGQQIAVIALCMTFNMLDGFDITAMAVVAKAVGQELSLTAEKLGWIFSFALAGMMIGAMVVAPISDIIGRRKMVIINLLLVGVSIILTARATSLPEFVMLRFISGIGAGAMLACQATLAAEYSPEKYRTLSVALVTAGYPMGAMMTSVVAGFIMPEYGWRSMFWFGGVVTLLMTFTAVLFIPESLKYLIECRPANALARVNKILLRLKKDPVSNLPIPDQTLNTDKGLLANMKSLIQPSLRSKTLILWTAFFLCFTALYALISWIPKLIEDAGFNAKAGQDAFFWFNLGGVIGIYVMGVLSTRLSVSNVTATLSIASAISMVVFGASSVQLGVMMFIIFVTGVLLQGGFTGLYAVAAKTYPTEIRSTGIGWAIGLGRSGAVVGPAVAGYIIAAGYGLSAIFYAFAIPMAIGGLIAYFLKVD